MPLPGTWCKELISKNLKDRLERRAALPSPPAAAACYIALAGNAGVTWEETADALAKDPAMAVRLLQLANSPFYSVRRRITTLRHAMLVLGLDATIGLALSFSLQKSLREGSAGGSLDYDRFWKRSILCAFAAQSLARRCGLRQTEEVFLCALIQDVGIMALDAVSPKLYAAAAQQTFGEIVAHERAELRTDHAEVGAWLLQRWGLPDSLQQAVAHSHRPEALPPGFTGVMTRCVSLAGDIADAFLAREAEAELARLAGTARKLLGIDKQELEGLLRQVAGRIPDAEAFFQSNLLERESATALLDKAREILLERNIKATQRVRTLQEKIEKLDQQTTRLEQLRRRDELTGLHNRAHLDEVLEQTFGKARGGETELSLVFADIDHFKRINDNFGHAVGDRLLVAAAGMMKSLIRRSDILARYGGEEFVIVLPQTSAAVGLAVCRRIIQSFDETLHSIDGSDRRIPLTVSAGLATLDRRHSFTGGAELLAAADEALYAAKQQGRNRVVVYEEGIARSWARSAG